MEIESEGKVTDPAVKQYIARATCKDLDFATKIKSVARPHIDSFNYSFSEGLEQVTKYLNPVEIHTSEIKALPFGEKKEVTLPSFKKIKIWYEELYLGKPSKVGDITSSESRLFPSECRIKEKSYVAPLFATVCRIIDDGPVEKLKLTLSDIPVMVKTNHCHLANCTSKELVERHEDCNEFGGYFIIHGLEKIVRMLIIPKKNYPIAFMRTSVRKKNANFTGHVVQMKCVREDLFSKTIALYYVSDGNIYIGIIHRKQEFLIPIIIILKALVETTDVQIYNKLVRGYSGNSDISDRVEVLLRVSKSLSLHTKVQCLSHLGSKFRMELGFLYSSDVSDKELGEIFLREHICVHSKSNIDKVNIISLMVEKLYALVAEKIQPDNLDSLINQEVLLSGHIYLMMLRERLEETLEGVKIKIVKECQMGSVELKKMRDINYIKRAIDSQTSIGSKLEYFLSTGNIRSQTGLDLQQQSGYAIIADKLNNMRYFSHFRSIHRGAFFSEMKTTTVRKLLPEVWGFVCPVHTPDGGPCGLLNHIATNCTIVTSPQIQPQHANLVEVCSSLGMLPNTDLSVVIPSNYIYVVLDGRVIGYVEPEKANDFVRDLRYIKVMGDAKKPIPATLEIGFIPPTPFPKAVQFAGIFLATLEARFTRPVKNLQLNNIEWIGPLEQSYLSIACVEEDVRNDTTHQELDPSHILSILASQVPFLNYNQSPRNMYQCQMAKQTMGTPYHNHPYRFDNKIYRLMTPQIPIVKCSNYDEYGLGDYPSGTNAVVAVLAYTGYDMEDAMIINKSAYERGFGHGCVYKSYMRKLNDNGNMFQKEKSSRYKLLSSMKKEERKGLHHPVLDIVDKDGIPKIGTHLKKGAPELVVYDTQKQDVKVFRTKDTEPCKLEQAAIISDESNPADVSVLYKVRFTRNPIIGDKFSSRHGQKGVLSFLWPQIDMPFTESGIQPDVIINPHAFPSRMTIGMLIESMAGKKGSMEGKIQETTAFKNYQDDDAVKHFGEQLTKYGYNYYGNEVMYSGIYGTQLKADIYIGVVYYQRLRHMVSDKYQARATGPVDVLTQQPVKGRKKQGGIRVGEMERDAFLAHGISYVLHDRLLNCSDRSEGLVCLKCGSILSPYNSLEMKQNMSEQVDEMLLRNPSTEKSLFKRKIYCRVCDDSNCTKVVMPFVLRYLCNELAGMNIKMTFNVA
jgi:DNA-directed RNA polymerase I subunit RPA2